LIPTQGHEAGAVSCLTSATSSSGNRAFTYDATGNRLTHKLNSVTTNYATAIGSNRLMSLSGGNTRGYQYTPNGNVSSTSGSGATTFTYDPFNRLKYATTGGHTAAYQVNALGQRKVKFIDGAPISLYTHDPAGNVLLEYEAALANVTWTIRLFGEPLVLRRSGQNYFIHTDHLGRPELMTNASKAVVWRANNYAFDRSVAYDAIGGQNTGYPGQSKDNETGLWHNYMRDYDGLTGRYIQSDPIGLGGGLNTYAYVGGNPIANIDPLGLESPQYSIGQIPGNVAWNQKPDFLQLSLSYYVGSYSITLSRSGKVFTTSGASRSYPHSGKGLGISLNAGHLFEECPTSDEQGKATDELLNGLSYSASGHALIGGGIDYSPGSGGAALFGFGAGVQVSPGAVSSAWFDSGVSW